MHSKQKGAIGTWSVATHLVKLGYPVFVELSDLSKTDLIVLVNNKPIKIQVKAITLVNVALLVRTEKSGPGYKYTYEKKDVDVFAIYCLDTEDIAFISSKELLMHRTMTLRINNTKNSQDKKIHNFNNYKEFLKSIK